MTSPFDKPVWETIMATGPGMASGTCIARLDAPPTRVIQFYDNKLNVLIQQLRKLTQQEDPATVIASQEACTMAYELASGLLDRSIPAPRVAVGIGQGVVFVWRRGNARIHVHFSEDGRTAPYLYHSDGEDFGTIDNCDGHSVVEMIRRYFTAQ